MKLLAGRRPRAVVPAWRGELLRLLDRFPRLSLPALSVLARLGRGRRERWRRQVGA
jgi:hypothetical protein